ISSRSTSWYPGSSRLAMRLRASSPRWCPHLGHTCRLASNSALKTYCPQPSHFCHSPSVRTLFSAVFGSISFSCRLNQDMYFLPPLVPGGVDCLTHERTCPDFGAYSHRSHFASDYVQHPWSGSCMNTASPGFP